MIEMTVKRKNATFFSLAGKQQRVVIAIQTFPGLYQQYYAEINTNRNRLGNVKDVSITMFDERGNVIEHRKIGATSIDPYTEAFEIEAMHPAVGEKGLRYWLHKTDKKQYEITIEW